MKENVGVNESYLWRPLKLFSMGAVLLSARTEAAEKQSSFESQISIFQQFSMLTPSAANDLRASFGSYYENRNQDFEDCMELRNTVVRCNGSLKLLSGQTKESQCQEAQDRQRKMDPSSLRQCSLFVETFEHKMELDKTNGKKDINYQAKCSMTDGGGMKCT